MATLARRVDALECRVGVTNVYELTREELLERIGLGPDPTEAQLMGLIRESLKSGCDAADTAPWRNG